MGDFSKSLSENREKIEMLLQDCADIIQRPMQLGKGQGVACLMVYVEVTVSNVILEESAIGRLMDLLSDLEPEEFYRVLDENAAGISDAVKLATLEEAMAAMLAGNAIFLADGYDFALKLGSKGYPGLGVAKAESEKVLRGTREAFSESAKVNTALLRKRIRDTRLKAEERFMGRYSHTLVVLVYVEELLYPGFLEQIKKGLEEIDLDGIEDSGMVEQLLGGNGWSPFPRYQATERPDRAAAAILQGRVVMLCDNSPEALLLPATMNHLLQAPDDYFGYFGLATFLRLIRYGAAFLALFLPGLYLAVIGFHAQILPTNLILSLAGARQGVPFPGMAELLFLELSFELMQEAGLRMPGQIGNTIGIVGGLIIGQAAVTANLVSPIVVIVVAMTALGSYSIPNEELSGALRLLKYGMIVLCGCLGIYGFIFGMTLLLIHLSARKSLGVPYLLPFAAGEVNRYADEKDGVFRAPLGWIRRRSTLVKRQMRKRSGKPEQSGEE